MDLTRSPTPERALKNREIQAVARALIAAWHRLPTEILPDYPKFDPSKYGDEDYISERLIDILNRIQMDGSVPGFTEALFQDVTRDSKVAGEFMPDFRFALLIRPAHITTSIRSDLAFLVEAKVFKGKRGLPLYYSRGIQRFVDGLYSPRTDVGMMLAYCIDPKAWPFPESLETFISKAPKCVRNSNGIGGLIPWKPVSGVSWGATKHRRAFRGTNPHDFELLHLWLNVNHPTAAAS